MRKSLFFSVLFLAFSVQAEVHKWTDQQGNIHYTSSDVLATQYSKRPGFINLKTDQSSTTETINCNAAVFNTKDSIDAMLLVGLQNFRDGYVEESEYNHREVVLSRIKNAVSIGECKSSDGETADFYRCMAGDNYHVLDCGRQYSYGY